MRRSLFAVSVLLVSGGLALTGCTGPKPFFREGDADKVEIGYSGDVEKTLPLAQKHCAEFERSARLLDAGADIARYECVRR